ncbi:very large A-kinase anchor protein [Bufo gargarizans]|uniref:very large A-kinase anchor protein n=1 Tax=Bufo gargarizans TaxID=30331 RepID=UPI001CF558A2|nr:very large A-kinase anchor protein [Bufo gargarizans]
MSTRRRASTWQDEVARSFSRLFSRSSSQEKEEESGKDPAEEQDRGGRSLPRLFFRSQSQEKKDGSDRTEPGEEQERPHSPSRLFFRKISLESKGGNDKGNKEEQDRSKVFSRLFTRTSSQDKEEENDTSTVAREDQSRLEDNHSNLIIDKHEELPSTEPELVTLAQSSSPPVHNISEPEEENDGEFPHNFKVLDSEKQSRENFFHFIGNLFHFSPKSSLGNPKQGAGVQEPCKEHVDAQDKNNLDKGDLNQERTLDDRGGTEEASQQNTARHEQENPEVSGEKDSNDVLERFEDATTDTPKLNGHTQDAPLITYGTYRGSRRIRKLLKRRADVNSPISEKEETPETSSVGDANTENCLMLHDRVKKEPAEDLNGEVEMPPSKIHIKKQSKLEPLDQNAKLHNDDNIIRNAKNLKLTNDLETKDTSICTNSGEVANSSEIVEGQQPNIEEFLIAVPQLNGKGSSEIILQPNTDLQPTLGGSSNISGHLRQNVDNAEGHTVESTISRKSESNNEEHYTDDEPKTVDISGIVGHKKPNTNDVSKQQEDHQPDKESVHFPENRQKSIDDDSKTETGSSPKVAENLLPHTKEMIKDCLIGDIQANTNSSQKSETFSVMDNLCSSEFSTEGEDTFVRTEELEDTKVPVGLENCVADKMQSALQQSHLEIGDSGEWPNSQQVVEENLHVKEKPHEDLSDNLHLTTHSVSGMSSDKNYEDFNSPVSYLKPEIERPDIIDLHPNAQLISSSTIDVEPMGNSVIKEQMQLHGDEYFNQPNPDLNITILNKSVSESEPMPNSHLQLNGMSVTSKDLQQIESVGDLPANADIIPENDLQNDEELLKTEQQPNTNIFFQLKELNDTILEKTRSGSEDIPNLDLQLNKTRSSKLLDHTVNTENLQTNANIMPENGPQKDGELLQSNTKVNSQLKESSDESLLKSRIISKMIENQKPNIHIESNVSDSTQAEVEEPSKVNLCQETNSKIHVPEVNNDYLIDRLSQNHEFVSDEGLAETRDNNRLVNEENIHVDKPDGTVKEQDIENAIFDDHHESVTVPESCVDYTSSLNTDQESITCRNISFDNGIECRSPSPITISDSSSYADCNDVQFDSPNDSGIVSSQAYTPDEHFLITTFPSEIFIKTVTEPFAVDQKSEEFSGPKDDSIVNVQSVPKMQTKEPVININKSFEDQHASHGNGSTSNTASDISFKISTPDKVVKLNSDICIAKVSMKTVNIEEVKISPHGLYSDIISVAKVESPTFTKEVICLPQSSPPPTENAFQVFHGVEEHKDFVTSKTLLNHSGEYLTVNNCDKHPKNKLDTDEMLLYKDSDVTVNLISDLPNNQSDSIPQYNCIEESPKITDKSSSMLIENLRNNNVNVCTSDIINAPRQAHISDREIINETLMSSDSLKDLKLGESLSELNPDSTMNHREKLSDLLLHSALLQNAADTNGITSLPSANAKSILLGKDVSKPSNELFEQKANEIIFSVLHSAIDELRNIHQRRMNIMPSNNHTLTDIKLVKENVSEKLEDHPDEVLVKCPEKPSDHILTEDTDLIMSMAVGIVNDVISSSKQLVVSNIYPDVLSKDFTTDEATQQKPPSVFNGLSMDNQHDLVEDATNSNHVISSFDYDNEAHPPSCEVNSNDLEVTTEVSLKVEARQATKPRSDELGSKVTEDMNEKDADKTIETNILTKTEVEEHLSFSKSSPKADTYSLINEPYINGDLMLDDIHCDRQMGSFSLGTEGSMEDFNYINICEESSNRSDFSDFLQFSVHNSKYVEISGSDDESTDEEKDCGSEQASGNDSYVPVQSRRVRIYPLALSPIYEDDSACDDSLSNNSSPKYNEGASNSGCDHTSILSLLQSVSDRLKEADLEETSDDERFLALSNEVSFINDRYNKEEPGELEDISPISKTIPNVPSTLEDKKTSLGTRSGLFITKSFAENKPNLVSGRQSLLLNLTSHSNIYGSKSSLESSSVPSLKSETSVSPTVQSTDLSPSTAAVNSLSSEPVLPIQSSPVDHKPHISPKSVYYQYFHAAQNYLSNIEDNGSPAQEKLEEPKKTAEPYMDFDHSESLKFNPRPGKVILSDIVDQENKIELKADVLDATSWEYPNGVNIRVIRGCWILYEKPHFEGQAHVLEEGEAVLRHLWDQQRANAKPDKITIGSVKRVVKDYLPEVVISSLQDVSDSPIYIRAGVPSLENLVGNHPRSLVVNSGVWLAYTEPQYNGTVTVLEEDSELPQIQDSGFRSIRPLKMGGLKVQLPSDPKIIIYEKPHFQGWWREITEHVCSIGTLTHDGENSSCQDIGSIQVLGGIWVGYENEKFKGQQYLLEEGDYEDWLAWGGYNNALQSIRYLQADFLESSVTLYETDEDGKQINLFNQAVPDLEMAGYNTRTQCIHVTKGMWVAYQEKHFCGEQYVLEKGRYKSYMHWGGSNNTILSIRPILLEPLGRNDVKHLIKAYSGAEFQGESMDFTQGVSCFTSFMPMSFKILRGCWLLCYEADSSDNLCVLEEGHFPDLALCGCPTAVIKYFKPIDYVFAEPSISLFALDSCEGRELHFEDAVTSVLSKDLHFYAQSVWVRRGLWIAFEGANFLGRQMLLDPQQIRNWSQFSGWKAVGSLRPVKQPSVYFMVKNRDNDKYLTITGKLADARGTFVSVAPRNRQTTQIWYFSRGFLKSKVNGSCLDVIGGKNIQGSKVSLWAEHGKTRQKWKINKDGTISSYLSDDLVLDLKGGNYYDQNYLVVNKVLENALTQKWDIEIL